MARRAFLHVGTAKSGTTFLQDLWWQQRDELRERGLLLPGTGRRDHFAAAALVKGMTDVVATFDASERGAWRRLVDETGAWSGDESEKCSLVTRTSPTSPPWPRRCTWW